MAAMRIFTGIQLSEEAREQIVKELDPFKRIAPSIRWTGKNNIHLTLKFIGDVEQGLSEKIAAVLAAAKIPLPPFRLRFSGFGKFPVGDDLHIFWAGVGDDPRLLSLFNAIEALLFPLGVARETRPFQPHLTLGRNKARADFRALFELLAEKKDLFLADCPVAAFQLFRSDLTQSGPVYSILKEIPLVAA
jgi:2'-5' RNA ligase